jgi:predicted amidophosphoribosyltransferase
MGSLTRKKRLQNVSGAFRLKDGNLDVTMGKNILFIDDLVTTCATMESCASLLMSHGKAASVSALVLFARYVIPSSGNKRPASLC